MRTNLDNQAATFRNSDRFYPNRVISKGATTKVLSNHARSLCNLQYSYYGFNFTLKDYFSRHRAAGLLILKNGQIALEQYAMGNSESSRWTSFSVAKSVTSTLIGAAVHEGAINSVDDTVQTYLPSFKGSAYAETTIQQLLSMTSGMAWSENYVARGRGSLNSLLDAAKTNNSENVLSVMRNCKRAVPAGTKFNYNTGETYLLGAILEAATRRKLSNYFTDTIATPMGMETDGYWLLDAFDGLEMGGGNFSATLRDYGRFGQFF
jgi:CubicO group peptidase (beta-lactamase class C family)